MPRTSDAKGLSSTQFILLSLVAGIIAGLFFGERVAWLQYVGDIFIRLLQITVIPYISLSLITGLGGLKQSEIAGLAKVGGAFILLIWVIASIIVIIAPMSFPDWPTASFFSQSLVEASNRPDFLRLFIPSNPFYSYANAIIPAVVVFSILMGIALIRVESKEFVLGPLVVCREALMKITGLISKLAPLVVFSLLASAMGTIDLGELSRLQVYIVLYASLAAIMALWVLPAMIAALTPLGYFQVLRALRTPLVTAFATGSSLIVLPLLINQCRYLISQCHQLDTETSEQADALVEVLVPTAYPFLSPATLLSLIFLLFGGWYTGTSIATSDYTIMFMAGIPTLFAGTTIALPALLDLLKLPQDLFQVFISVDVITVRFGTLLSAMHYAAIALLGAFFLVSKHQVQWPALIRLIIVTIVLLAAVLFGVRSFYTYAVAPQYTKADAMQSLQLRNPAQPAVVHTSWPSEWPETTGKLANLSEIDERGVLKVCFQPNEYPSSFYSNSAARDLVGFDIEMAHLFAAQRQLTLEFFPTTDELEASDLLNAGICDIYMRTLPVSAGRTEKFNLTNPVYTSSTGFIVKDHRRAEFSHWNAIVARGDKVTIAVDRANDTLAAASKLLPEANVVPIRDMEEQASILESMPESIDAIMDMSEEGAAWSVIYPQYSVVVPQPPRFVPVSYAVAKGNDDLLKAIDAWILVIKANGTIDQNYNYWMLGGAAKSERPPRWSVIKDVLKWKD
jgi:Na+/H+-dicarboxylate symporter/ABC-type amino acid transport substrate-binding protein